MEKRKVIKINKLTPMQSGMLFHSLLNPNAATYCEQNCYYIEGNINIKCLKEAWQKVVDRYEVFRTDFRWKNVKTPAQIVVDQNEADITEFDITDLSEVQQEEYIGEFKREDLAKKFDFENGHLNRLSMIKLSDNKYFMCWTFHHILLDGWSVSIVLSDFFNIYNCFLHKKPLPEKTITQFSDYLMWLKKQNQNKGLKFWQDYMKEFEQPTLLPYDQNPKKDEIITDVATRLIRFTEEKTQEIEEFCKNYSITTNAFIQTAWGILLQKFNNSSQSCFGMTVSGRPVELKKVESIVGNFLNTLPVLVQTKENSTVKELLIKTNDELVEIREYEYVSLAEIQNMCNHSEKLFDSIVVFENFLIQSEVKEVELDFSVSYDSAFEMANYDFAISVGNDGSMIIKLSYNEKVFSSEVVERIEKSVIQLINTMLTEPDQLVAEISIISAEEKELVLFEWNNTEVDYPKTTTIQQLFEEQVLRTPNNCAIVYKDQKLTYRELNEKANQLARVLRTKGVGLDQVVGIMLDRSLEMIIGVLAIVKAGGAY
ncbi:MAG: AMP-binding protein, partial [Halanaerobiales bacterium]|nr:AMP-binding protein [Halanaerobiales bacterium]